SSARGNDHEVLLVTSDEGSAGLRRLAGRALCDAIVLMDLQAVDERVPVAGSLRVPVVLVGVPDDPQGLHSVDLDFAMAARLAVADRQVLRPPLRALSVRGVIPGRDISVIGLSTDSDAENSEPPLTNVSLEPRDVSRRAMETLFWLLDPRPGAPPSKVALVPP